MSVLPFSTVNAKAFLETALENLCICKHQEGMHARSKLLGASPLACVVFCRAAAGKVTARTSAVRPPAPRPSPHPNGASYLMRLKDYNDGAGKLKETGLESESLGKEEAQHGHRQVSILDVRQVEVPARRLRFAGRSSAGTRSDRAASSGRRRTPSVPSPGRGRRALYAPVRTWE